MDGVELLVAAEARVGEGPVWDERLGVLWWVDITGRSIHRTDPSTGVDATFEVGQQVGAIALCESRQLVVALQDGLATFDIDTGTVELVCPIDDKPGMRMNDGKVGPDGHFWVGRMAIDEQAGAGSLLRFGVDGRASTVLDGVTLANGLDWSPDGQVMYFIDTPTGSVDILRLSAGGDSVVQRDPLARFADGLPDGLTVDAEGCLWVGLWGGWGVERLDQHGRMLKRIHLPCENVTSCAFGGPDLDQLFVTTACEGLSDAERAAQPAAGGLFRSSPGVQGLPARRFAW